MEINCIWPSTVLIIDLFFFAFCCLEMYWYLDTNKQTKKMLFTDFSARDALSSPPPQPLLFASLSASKLFHLTVSNCWSAGGHLENHGNGLPLERATWDFCSFLSCGNGMQDILWFIFPFLIRYERNIKRNSEKFPFSPNEMKYKALLLKTQALFFFSSGILDS